MHFVYVIQSIKDRNLYIGCSNNLKERIIEHNNGIVTSTKNRRPFKLIYYEAFLNKEEAEKKEQFYKSGRGHEVLYKILFKTLSNKNEVVV